MNMMRLNKYISNAGYTSRRKADELIFNGSVKVNGIIVNEPGTQIDIENDSVEINNIKLFQREKEIYIALNKPMKYISSVKDQFDRPSILDLVKVHERIYPVGRLDYDSSGLILLTNDGDLTYKLTHPKHDIYKTYLAKVEGTVEDIILERLRKGIYIDNYRTRPCKIEILHEYNNTTELEISIMEGRNRQIRKMFEKFNNRVIALKRISIGEIDLENLDLGKWRYLTAEEIKYLKEII